jgi:hypothetical protein
LKRPDSENKRKQKKAILLTFVWICFLGTRALVVEARDATGSGVAHGLAKVKATGVSTIRA